MRLSDEASMRTRCLSVATDSLSHLYNGLRSQRSYLRIILNSATNAPLA